MATATNCELQRNDYSAPGTTRTSNATTQSDIDRIYLQVTDLQKTVVQEVIETKRNKNPTSYLQNHGRTNKRIVIKGTISKDGSIDAGYLEDDLDYATRWWFNTSDGVITLSYTHGGLTRTETGYIEKYSSKETSGIPDSYDFDMTFIVGTKRS